MSGFEPNSEDEPGSLTVVESRYMDGISDKEYSDTSVISDEDGELHCSADIKRAMAQFHVYSDPPVHKSYVNRTKVCAACISHCGPTLRICSIIN